MRRIIAFSILNHSAFAGSRVAVALAGLQLHASPFAIGLILSFYSLLPMFLAVPAGRWIDRIGMRVPMLIGTGALAFGIIVPFLAWDIGGLYLASVTIGVGFMAFHLCVQKAAGDLGGDAKRKEYFSQLALGYSVSGFLGPTLSGFAIDLLGHRVVFGLLAIAPALAWIALQRYRFEHLRVEPEHALPERAASARVLDLLDVPDLRRMYLAIVLISACWDVHQFLVPLYGALHGLSASSIGLVLGSFAVATFVIRLAMPLFLHRYSEWRLILIAMWICAIVYAAYPWFPTLPVMLTLSFVLGLGLGVCQPMILTVLHKSAPPGRVGEATGLRMTLVSATQTVLPTVFGAMGGVLGLAPMFLGMTTLVAVGAVLARRGLPADSLVGGAAMVSDPKAESEDKL
jgi:predicted MFS family arabinose efflux permease